MTAGNVTKLGVGMQDFVFEPIGSSCEVGFVLERRGDKRPAVLRWTAISTPNLIRLLEADFANPFTRQSIIPHTSSMVLEKTYDWAFHSALTSDDEGQFTLKGPRFDKLFKIEQARVIKGVKDFRERLRSGKIIAIHAADDVSDDSARALLAAIDTVANNKTNRLLIVGSAGAGVDAGVASEISSRLYRGYVRELAPYYQTDAADYEGWNTILDIFEPRAPSN